LLEGRALAEELIGQYGYFAIVLLLVLGGLGLPVPEEVPVVLAAILSKKGTLWAPLAFGSCVLGVLLGDFVVYGLGYIYGERVLRFRLTRKFLTRAREVQIKGYFDRHGLKILIVGRFAVGFRTAAYLTAGILRHPPLKLLGTDLIAVMLSTPLMFGLGWVFAHQIEVGIQTAQHYLALILAVALSGWLLYRHIRARARGGQPVGPPVPESDRVPVPPGDLELQAQSSPSAPSAPKPDDASTEAETPSETDDRAPKPDPSLSSHASDDPQPHAGRHEAPDPTNAS